MLGHWSFAKLGHSQLAETMPRLIALEWDAQEARVVIARTRGAGVGIEHALTIPLPTREAGAVAEADVGPVLAKALADYGVARTETLVAVGRFVAGFPRVWRTRAGMSSRRAARRAFPRAGLSAMTSESIMRCSARRCRTSTFPREATG